MNDFRSDCVLKMVRFAERVRSSYGTFLSMISLMLEVVVGRNYGGGG
jgi:hypothetical protein